MLRSCCWSPRSSHPRVWSQHCCAQRSWFHWLLVLAVALAVGAACSSPPAPSGAGAADIGADSQTGSDATLNDALLGDAAAADTALMDSGTGDTALTDGGVGDSAASDTADTADTALDAMATDGGKADATKPDVDVVVPKGEVTAVITSPIDGAVVEAGKPVDLAGAASDTVFANDQLTVTWTSSVDGVLWQGPLGADGQTLVKGVVLSPGAHQIALEVANPTGVSAQAAVGVGVCSWQTPQSFDTQLDGAKWQIFGDAYWDAGGWLEMTGNAQSKFGKIWNVAEVIKPGDVQISFDFQTGGGINGGADGFAMSVFEAENPAELQTILAATKDGGCLGYGVSGACGTLKVKGFHVEIDTFHNTGDPNQDPTWDNHIAVVLDGDASKHVLWKATPGIEDLQWHTVSVQVDGAKVTVKLDGNQLFSGVIPDFEFRGGYIGFSGSTGWASNWHRFDNLQILQQCLVP